MKSSPKTAARPCSPVRGVYVDVRRETWSQGIVTRTGLGDGDPHRNTLHDLGEVSRCVVRRKERELRSGRAADARDLSLADAAAVGVDLELHRLAGTNLGELGLLKVRGDPDTGVSDDAEQRLSRRDELSFFHLLSRNLAGGRRGDVRVIELQLSFLRRRTRGEGARVGDTHAGFHGVHRSAGR